MDFFSNHIGEIVGSYLATISALIVLYFTILVEKRKEKNRKLDEERSKISHYCSLLWTLSQELSLVLRHKELIETHVSVLVESSKNRGEVINRKNSLFFSIDHLKTYRVKFLESEYHQPILVSLLSVLIATLETTNMSLDFDQLYELTKKARSKEEFNNGLDLFHSSFKEDYMNAIHKQNEKIQQLIEVELKTLKPDLRRLKEEDTMNQFHEILKPNIEETNQG